jgi:hypothetical protein
MIYVNKFGLLKIVDELDDSSNGIMEETIEIFDSRKLNEI